MTVEVLVTYDSGTGNTAAMAEEVAEGARAGGAEVVVKRVEETSLDDLLAADCIMVGSPTYYGQMSAKVKDLFDRSVKVHRRLEGKVGAAFTSVGGGLAYGAETTIFSILEAMLIHGMVVQGRSRGQHYGAAAEKAPDERERRMCRELAERAVNLTARLTQGG
jgi:NAD(P)H dehydrogenase (quinone)